MLERSETVAYRFLDSAERTFRELLRAPASGTGYRPRRPDAGELRIRQIRGFKNHLIFFRSVEDGIEIVRVLHGARDWQTLLEDE